jgi:hypothetical protein
VAHVRQRFGIHWKVRQAQYRLHRLRYGLKHATYVYLQARRKMWPSFVLFSPFFDPNTRLVECQRTDPYVVTVPNTRRIPPTGPATSIWLSLQAPSAGNRTPSFSSCETTREILTCSLTPVSIRTKSTIRGEVTRFIFRSPPASRFHSIVRTFGEWGRGFPDLGIQHATFPRARRI